MCCTQAASCFSWYDIREIAVYFHKGNYSQVCWKLFDSSGPVSPFLRLRRPQLDRRTIRVLNQGFWLKSLTARQRCLAANANGSPFLRNKSAHVPTPNLEDQEAVFVRPVDIDQPGMRDSVSVAGTPPSIAQWIAEMRKPSHPGRVQSLRDWYMVS
ncbi:hypothetical protein CSKR_112416 [Clonorchis sinensis]|uniref:Uncharacterized protein n=1 Tax=Clonorchis sinensis TaxID=79923 RepID=A0A419Q615_CLOSI|nr:hypothetical protein CSKR_112416 [Clonorchis sinensis]